MAEPKPEATGTISNDKTDETGELPADRDTQDREHTGNEKSRPGEPEEALETHEVVELNKFTTKKEWIEEKIKLLESIPPIEVFAAVETLVSMAQEVPPELPTRTQLNHWLEEHDKTEKETEIFDAEDMSKLKKWTKAATQRNLSPEDTDLIELTLTTLLALDKLLHLLRDRSETLDLLGLRLSWEEQRVAAWRERNSLLDDLRSFLTMRARWSLDTYEFPVLSTPSPSPAFRFTSPSPSPRPSPAPSKRRDSTASLTSISSDISTPSGLSSAFSRSTRYKLAELLSQDAALFSGRLTSLNHGKIMPAGKTLDKLIDASRTPVPDEILDEQDRLEDKGIKEIETVGKFAMTVVMQWKRADEHYNDTKKDQSAAQMLIAEVNNARIQHPTARCDAAFMSRAQALAKRLAVRGDPALSRSSFLHPAHPLFPEQGASNEEIVKTISIELAEAVKLAREAENAALEYHAGLEGVRRAELLRNQMQDLDEQVKKLVGTLVQGVYDEQGNGDGSPLDLNDERCLDSTRHVTYLALLPSIIQQLDTADRVSNVALRDGKMALLRLKELSGIDASLKHELTKAIEVLEGRRAVAQRSKEDVLAKTQRLKEARRLWLFLNEITGSMDELEKEAINGMSNQKWRVRESHRNAPLTPDPDSPMLSHTPLPTTLTPSMLLQCLDALEKRMSSDFQLPFVKLGQALEQPPRRHLQLSLDDAFKRVGSLRSMGRLWEGILRQAENMLAANREANDLDGKIDELKAAIDDTRQEVLSGDLGVEAATTAEVGFKERAKVLRGSVQNFTDTLAARVPLVSLGGTTPTSPMSGERRLNGFKEPHTLPFDLSNLDNGVRSEVNALVLGLAGSTQSVDKKIDYLRLARLAKSVDAALGTVSQETKKSGNSLSEIDTLFGSIKETKPSGLDTSLSQRLSAITEQLESFTQDHRKRISRSSSPVRQALETLKAARGAHDSPIYGTIITPRIKSVDETFRLADAVLEDGLQLRIQIEEAARQEDARFLGEEEKLQTEKTRMEKERIEAETKARLDQERINAEELTRQEKERLKAEKERLALTSKLEQGRLESETIAKSVRQNINEERSDADENDAGSEEKSKEFRKREKGSQELQLRVSEMLQRTPEEDVFGLRLTPTSTSSGQHLQELTVLRTRIMSLRNRLRSLSLHDLLRSSSVAHDSHVAALPTSRHAIDVQSKFSAVASDIAVLPASAKEDTAIDAELISLRSEADSSRSLVQRITQLGQFGDKVAACDGALSDLLEHADSYPSAPPPHQLASSHVSDAHLPCEEQLSERLTFTKRMVEDLSTLSALLPDDLRVAVEEKRIKQAFVELADMCMDRINGARSRPVSSISSTGRSSAGSVHKNSKPSLNPRVRHPRVTEKSSHRSVSGTHDPIPRPSTHLSNRSVSGPTGFSSLFSSTFASRQRTTSLASIQSLTTTPTKRPMSPVVRPRSTSRRPGSPTFSEMSGHSLASTPSRSTWSRAPRQSFGSAPRSFPIHERTPKRKTYIANPKSKLDVAVGNVVNNFKMPVTIQAVSDGWKDQSGKYWIGEDEPKLCFCRILRSQTVMVRVGGGWCELSNFLRGHFAEISVELPPSPPRKEERWISSATVLEASEIPPLTTISRVLKTPEPQGYPLLPALQLSTPNGTSPQSLKTSSSTGGSPGLTPFQFLRKAEPGARAVSPSPSKSARHKPTTPSATVTPARTSIWRP